MIEAHFFTLVVVILFAAALAYKISLLHTKSVGKFSLLQLLYLVIVPGFIFPLAFSYVQSILERPLGHPIVFSDGLLINIILLSMMFAYGGIAIHAVTKMLSTILKSERSKAYELNRYFHLTFSHNLIFGGAAMVILGLTLLELNHVPQATSQNILLVILKSLLFGGTAILGLYLYNPYQEDRATTRWADLKSVFLILWLAFMVILYAVRKIDPSLSDYQLLMPALLSFSLLAFLSAVLVLRKLKRGGWRLVFKWQRLKRFFW